jgi:D-glycero-D-manno-heptose 1,7-bisphosphate phosphatase
MEIIPGAIAGLQILATLPAHIIVVSNQAGIARGLFTREQMSAFNARLRAQVEKSGGRIDAFYFCPHFEPHQLPPGVAPCSCSKPNPGMLLEAAADFQLQLSSSYLVGDKSSDIVAGKRAGCRTVLVLTGKAGREEGATSVQPDFVREDLFGAAQAIAADFQQIELAPGGKPTRLSR